MHKGGAYRGYIAMLAVLDRWRGAGVGTRLVRAAIRAMANERCDEVVLEAEVTNRGALRLYEQLGFIRDKLLEKYYLNGNGAYRLKLRLQPFHRALPAG
jgi:N-alpha-acetyltransferase 30